MSDIRVMNEGEQQVSDARFNTTNTKLASALLVMGFTLSKQPFSTVLNLENPKAKTETTIHLCAGIVKDNAGKKYEEPLMAYQVQAEWIAQKSSKMPFVTWMRKGLEARDFILKQFIKKETPSHLIAPSWAITDNLKFAAVVTGCGYAPMAYRDKKFYFEPKAALIIADCMTPEEGKATRAQWSLMAIRQQDILIRAIREPENATMVKHPSEDGERILYIGADAPDELKRVFLRKLEDRK